jgi:hypothetical protein
MQRINFSLTTGMLCLIGLIGLYPDVAVAEVIYKCVEKGKITISTEACPAGATSAKIINYPEHDAAAVATARAEEERLQRYVETLVRERNEGEALARERRERVAAYDALRKSRAEQAALEAQAQRDAEAAADLRHVVVYDGWPVYGPTWQGRSRWPHHENRGGVVHGGERSGAKMKAEN